MNNALRLWILSAPLREIVEAALLVRAKAPRKTEGAKKTKIEKLPT